MRRLQVFLIILGITFGVLLTLVFVGLYLATAAPSYYGSSWIGQMWSGMGSSGGNYGGMGGMMGNGGGAGSPSYLWLIPAALIAVSATAVIGVAFYLLFPELRYIRGSSCNPAKIEPAPAPAKIPEVAAPVSSASVSPAVSSVSAVSDSCEVLLKTMTPDEQKVMNVLIAHKGKYLQKYVVKEAGLSRLKTHRVVARFAERGIVTVKEFGNTNEVVLSDWVKDFKTQNAPSPSLS
jgi:hypothetical protein